MEVATHTSTQDDDIKELLPDGLNAVTFGGDVVALDLADFDQPEDQQPTEIQEVALSTDLVARWTKMGEIITLISGVNSRDAFVAMKADGGIAIAKARNNARDMQQDALNAAKNLLEIGSDTSTIPSEVYGKLKDRYTGTPDKRKQAKRLRSITDKLSRQN